MSFFHLRNHLEPGVTPCKPWEFVSNSTISETVRKDKTARQDWYRNPDTRHSFYTGIEGTNPNMRVSKANPPKFIHAAVYDIDVPLDEIKICERLKKLERRPAYWERSLGGNQRLVFILEEPVDVKGDEPFCRLVLHHLEKNLRVGKTFPGLDRAFEDATRTYANGGEGCWFAVNPKPVETNFVKHVVKLAEEDYNPKLSSRYNIPLDVVAAELLKKYPRFAEWEEPFQVESMGPSFWIEGSTSPKSAIVKEGGLFTFADHADKKFYNWGDLLGEEFVAIYRIKLIEPVIENIYVVGEEKYQVFTKKREWKPYSYREIIRHLRDDWKLTETAEKGKVSMIDEALNLIKKEHFANAVGHIPFNNARILLNDEGITLNKWVNNVVQPAADVTEWGEAGKFPFLSKVLDRIFLPKERQLDHFLAYFQHAYRGALACKMESGQVCFLEGISDSGKSLITRYIFAAALGGFRDGSNYVCGEESFNGELFQQGVVCIDDELMTSDEGRRTKYFSRVKQIASNQEQLVHQKFMQRVKIIWNGRIMITLNNDPMSRRVLVPIDPSTRMKYNFYRCFQWDDHSKEQAKRPPPWTWESRSEIERLIALELPFFCAWLQAWTRPDWIKANSRFGIESYQDESMLAATVVHSPETWTLHYINSFIREFFESNSRLTEWEGSMQDLFQALCMSFMFDTSFKQIKHAQFHKHLDKLLRDSRLEEWKISFNADNQHYIFKRPDGIRSRDVVPPEGQIKAANA